jgi:hypothetical protein
MKADKKGLRKPSLAPKSPPQIFDASNNFKSQPR